MHVPKRPWQKLHWKPYPFFSPIQTAPNQNQTKKWRTNLSKTRIASIENVWHFQTVADRTATVYPIAVLAEPKLTLGVCCIMQSALNGSFAMQNWNRLPNSSFARSKTTVTKTVLENNPVCLSDPNSAEPETAPKRQRKYSGNTDSKYRKCLTNLVRDMLPIVFCVLPTVKKSSPFKWCESAVRGLGICPNSAEQKSPSRSQTLPNKIWLARSRCFGCPF